MNNIIRAQRESFKERSLSEPTISLFPQTPRSPEHRLRRSDSRSQSAVMPIYENPCKPCKSRLFPRRNPSPTFAKIRAYAPYLSIACFVAILVFEIYSLHNEVYKLRAVEAHRRHSSASFTSNFGSSSSGKQIRRMQQSLPGRILRGGGGGRTDDKPPRLRPRTLDEIEEESGAEEEEEDIEEVREDELSGRLDSAEVPDTETRDKARGARSRKTAMELHLEELMATRDLLRSSGPGRRRATSEGNSPGPLPEYMQ